MQSKTIVLSLVAVILFAILLLFTAEEAEDSLTISAAASLKEACFELERYFEHEHPGVELYFNFASSGVLANQIIAGAPVDVFLSASEAHVRRLQRNGLLKPDAPVVFATNSLVLVQSAKLKKNIVAFEQIASSDFGRVAIGNPQTVPAGSYAFEALENMGLADTLEGRLVFAEHVRQVVDYVVRGEVDAGLVYQTDYEQLRHKLKIVASVAHDKHSKIEYVGVVIPGTNRRREVANEFVRMLASEVGKDIFDRMGFRADFP